MIEVASLRATPQQTIRIGLNPSKYIFFIPIAFKDEKIISFIYDRVSNQNSDGKTPKEIGNFNSSNIYIPFETDFTERVFTYEYYNYGHIIKNIGGIAAIIGTFMGYVMIMFSINFLYSLSNIFLSKNETAFKQDFVNYLLFSK